jgi:hypothetical protein
MCCGQKRTELRNNQAQNIRRTSSGNRRTQPVRTHASALPLRPTASTHQPADTHTGNIPPQVATRTSTPHSSIGLRYLENSPIRVRGLVSGMSYEFSGAAPVQQVDARDASSLLSTRFFRRA